MRRTILCAAVGAVLGLLAAAYAEPSSMDNLRFHMGLFDRKALDEELVSTVRKFDRLYVDFFTSGGDISRLHEFPAANMVKRRIVQEINLWSARGSILSHDRFMFDIKDVRTFRPDMGYVDTAESWMYLLRDLDTGRRARGEKQADIRVRYILRRHDGRWKVEDFEVYGAQEDMPALSERWFRS